MSPSRLRHGHTRNGTRTPTYYSWEAMRTRCVRPSHPAYDRYGGRGITVCERWAVFENFLRDMGERPAGMSLERIDNDKGYEPGNVRWATPREQMNNTTFNRHLTINGETLTIAQWARRAGLKDSAFRERLRHGWTPQEAVSRLSQHLACKRGHLWSKYGRVSPRGRRVCRLCERMHLRISRGWPADRALTAPLGARRKDP